MQRILIILMMLIFVSCNNNTVEKETYEDGTIKSQKTYKTNKEDKELIKEIQYHPNGKKYIEGNYKENQRDGYWASWFEDGQLWSEGNFVMGKSDGKRTVYHPNGKLYYEGVFNMDKRVGVWKFYSEAGDLVNEIDYDKVENQD